MERMDHMQIGKHQSDNWISLLHDYLEWCNKTGKVYLAKTNVKE